MRPPYSITPRVRLIGFFCLSLSEVRSLIGPFDGKGEAINRTKVVKESRLIGLKEDNFVGQPRCRIFLSYI